MASTNIVYVTIAETTSAAPVTLLRTGALISQGATTLAQNASYILTQFSDLASIFVGSFDIESMDLADGTVTVTTVNNHNIGTGKTIPAVIAGVTPSDYNGTYSITSTGVKTFTYPLVGSPSAVTVQGTMEYLSSVELQAMATTFFAQGSNQSVYVLELGVGSAADGVTTLNTYIQDPSLAFFLYTLPSYWDTESTAQVMVNNYSSPEKYVYFMIPTTTSTYTNWATHKAAFCFAQNPSASSTEFSPASASYRILSMDPSESTPMSFLSNQFLYGVTSYSSLTNAQISSLLGAGVNFAYPASEGGLSNTILKNGTFMDNKPFSYRYAEAWVVTNLSRGLANLIINGSQQGANSIIAYNQNGINALKEKCNAILSTAVAFGVIQDTYTVSAVSYTTYIANHPGDYAAGIYNGLSCEITPMVGFTKITIALNVLF